MIISSFLSVVLSYFIIRLYVMRIKGQKENLTEARLRIETLAGLDLIFGQIDHIFLIQNTKLNKNERRKSRRTSFWSTKKVCTLTPMTLLLGHKIPTQVKFKATPRLPRRQSHRFPSLVHNKTHFSFNYKENMPNKPKAVFSSTYTSSGFLGRWGRAECMVF